MNNCKVIHLISSLRRGGRERQLAVILMNSSAKAIVFNKLAGGYDDEYHLRDKLIHIKSTNKVKMLFELLNILSKEKPRIIWSWGGYEATLGLFISLIKPVRHINGSIRHGIVRINLPHLWRLFILHLSRNIVANSNAGLRANGLKTGMVLYNGLDKKFFVPFNKEQYLKENPGLRKIIKNEGFILISVANLVPYKDYFTILKALEQLQSAGYLFTYLIVGKGPNKEKIESEIINQGLMDSIFLLGQRTDVKELLSMSDLFIHSSLGEGCSNAILEAMASGIPLIVTDTGGSSEIIDKSYGRLFDYQDWVQLRKHLEWLMNNPTQRKEMGVRARETALNRFSVERMMIEYRKIVFQIAST